MTDQIVHIVDDDDAFRNSLEWLVGSEGLPTRAYASAEAFLDACSNEASGCLVTDLAMAGLSGLELHARLLERGINLPTIIITGHGDLPQAVTAFRGGVVDFIEKPFDDVYLLGRIAHCLEQDRHNNIRKERVASHRRRLSSLTAREREVMTQIIAGKLNKQIADALGISIKTVEVHRSRVMEKMHVQTLAELVRVSQSDASGSLEAES